MFATFLLSMFLLARALDKFAQLQRQGFRSGVRGTNQVHLLIISWIHRYRGRVLLIELKWLREGDQVNHWRDIDGDFVAFVTCYFFTCKWSTFYIFLQCHSHIWPHWVKMGRRGETVLGNLGTFVQFLVMNFQMPPALDQRCLKLRKCRMCCCYGRRARTQWPSAKQKVCDLLGGSH